MTKARLGSRLPRGRQAAKCRCYQVLPGSLLEICLHWVVADATFFHDCCINGDAQGKPKEEWDPWLVAWADRQAELLPEAQVTDLGDARAALHRILPATTVGYLVARAIAHLFDHASELIRQVLGSDHSHRRTTVGGLAAVPGVFPLEFEVESAIAGLDDL